jgi:Amino acid permease
VIRLVTSILDHEDTPAIELAASTPASTPRHGWCSPWPTPVPTRAVLGSAAAGFLAVLATYFLPTDVVFTFLLNSSGAVAVVVYLCVWPAPRSPAGVASARSPLCRCTATPRPPQ